MEGPTGSRSTMLGIFPFHQGGPEGSSSPNSAQVGSRLELQLQLRASSSGHRHWSLPTAWDTGSCPSKKDGGPRVYRKRVQLCMYQSELARCSRRINSQTTRHVLFSGFCVPKGAEPGIRGNGTDSATMRTLQRPDHVTRRLFHASSANRLALKPFEPGRESSIDKVDSLDIQAS
jgi:hypothetical protein